MSITDELREWARGLFNVNTRETLLAIADRIDAAHERDVTMARGEAVTELGRAYTPLMAWDESCDGFQFVEINSRKWRWLEACGLFEEGGDKFVQVDEKEGER